MGHHVLLLWLSLAVLISPVAATTSSPAQTGHNQEVEADGELYGPGTIVLVRVEVRDRHGESVADLREEDFAVYENGIKQRLFILERGPSEATGLGPNQYRVGYLFKGKLDGTYRKVRVVIRKKRLSGLKVKSSPDGFFAREKSRP